MPTRRAPVANVPGIKSPHEAVSQPVKSGLLPDQEKSNVTKATTVKAPEGPKPPKIDVTSSDPNPGAKPAGQNPVPEGPNPNLTPTQPSSTTTTTK